MKKMVTAAAMAVAFVVSGSASAMTVGAVFSGDGFMNGAGQWEVRPGDVFAATIMATLTTAEDDAGGLLSFSTEGALAPTGIVNIASAKVNDSDWAVGNGEGWTNDSAFGWGGTLGLLAPKGTATLFTIDFAAATFGTTDLKFADYEPAGVPSWDGNVLVDGTVLDGTIAYENAGIKVVPIPAAALLFGSALFGVAGFARRRKA